jgi:hypothetical protein
MTLNGFRRFPVFLPIGLVLGLACFSANAASPCKGLDETACRQDQSCRWVSGYTTKHGNSVAAYCRGVGKKSEQGLIQEEGRGTQSGANTHTLPSVTEKQRESEETDG